MRACGRGRMGKWRREQLQQWSRVLDTPQPCAALQVAVELVASAEEAVAAGEAAAGAGEHGSARALCMSGRGTQLPASRAPAAGPQRELQPPTLPCAAAAAAPPRRAQEQACAQGACLRVCQLWRHAAAAAVPRAAEPGCAPQERAALCQVLPGGRVGVRLLMVVREGCGGRPQGGRHACYAGPPRWCVALRAGHATLVVRAARGVQGRTADAGRQRHAGGVRDLPAGRNQSGGLGLGAVPGVCAGSICAG